MFGAAFVAYILIIAHNAFAIQYGEKETAQTTCFCSSPVVFASAPNQATLITVASTNCSNSEQPPLQGQHPGAEDHGCLRRLVPMEVRMWQAEWKKTSALPRLPTTLEPRNSTRQYAQIPEGSESSMARLCTLGLERGSTFTTSSSQDVFSTKFQCTEERKRERQGEQGKQGWQSTECCPSAVGSCYSTVADARDHGFDLASTCSTSTTAIRSGTSDCSAQVLPRHQPGSGGHSESDGKSRKGNNQAVVNRIAEGFKASRSNCATALEYPGSPKLPQTELAEAPSRFSSHMAKAVEAFQRSAAGIWRASGTSPTRTHNCTQESPEPQQAGCSYWDSHISRPWRDNRYAADPDSTTTFETEAQALVQQVQESLQQSIAAASVPEPAMEINSDVEEDRQTKRPRSMEPFANRTSPPDGLLASLPS